MKQALVQNALKVVHSPQVLVNIISKRVRQLGQGFRPLIIVDPRSTFMAVSYTHLDVYKRQVQGHRLRTDDLPIAGVQLQRRDDDVARADVYKRQKQSGAE